MTELLTWPVVVGGLACIAIAPFGFRRALRMTLWRPAFVGMWVLSVALGGATGVSLGRAVDAATRVYGFPFPAVVLQRNERGVWLDYVGLLSLPFSCLNALVGTGVALYLLALPMSFFAHRAAGEPGEPRA